MICHDEEVEFKSRPNTYFIEKRGVRNHTERLLSTKESEWLRQHDISRIRILNRANTNIHFTRSLINIYDEGDILGYTLWSFTWEHKVDEE